jgi:hypothetical protein
MNMDVFEPLVMFGAQFSVLLLFVVFIAYIFSSWMYAKGMRLCGAEHTFIAWIPVFRYYGMVSCTCKDGEEVLLYGRYKVSSILYKLWWLLLLIPWAMLHFGNYDSFITSAAYCVAVFINFVFLGGTFTRMFNIIDGTAANDRKDIGLGMLSGIFPVVGLVKFLITPYPEELKGENQFIMPDENGERVNAEAKKK